METRKGIPESGNQEQVLFRRGAGGRRLVSRLIHQHRYYGDDCIVYETPFAPGEKRYNIHYFVACGDREPVLIVAEERNDWDLEADKMVRRDDDPKSLGAVPGRSLSMEQIKRLGMSSPASSP